MATYLLNPFQPDIAYLYPMEILENLSVLFFTGGMDKQHRIVIGQVKPFWGPSENFLTHFTPVLCTYLNVLPLTS